jgi:hypothetical protein
MYLTSTLRRTLAIGGVSLLAVVGLIGWTRHNDEPITAGAAAPNAITGTTTAYTAPEIGNPEPVSNDGNAPVVYAQSPFGPEPNRAYAPPPAPAMAYASTVRGPMRRVEPAPRSYRRHRHVVVRRRPFSHSAVIVGGSAAGGALIGGLAGGGKGAAIGALAGGGGGLVYDRLTHKKTLVEK